jgi:hypothetical protein
LICSAAPEFYRRHQSCGLAAAANVSVTYPGIENSKAIQLEPKSHPMCLKKFDLTQPSVSLQGLERKRVKLRELAEDSSGP